MIYITGDTHGDFTRFNTTEFPEQSGMTKDDFVIICGDFGGIFAHSETDSEKYWLNWLNDKPFTTLFIDGNHENYERLNSYSIQDWHGGKVQAIRPNVLHLLRGQVFSIESKTFFTFGGARSHDIHDGILEPSDPCIKKWSKDNSKLFRINRISWWKEEMPTQEEMDEGLANLKANNNRVDYILTHSPCTSVLKEIDGGCGFYKPDELTEYLQLIKSRATYTQWFFGHLHLDIAIDHENSCCLFEQIVRIS